MSDFHEAIKKLASTLQNCPALSKVSKEKKKIASLESKLFHQERDALDDYTQYSKHVQNLNYWIKDDFAKVKSCFPTSFSDHSIAELGSFFRFLNRCTMKLAEIDILAKRALSQAHKYVEKSNHLRFLDLCGGPGGFAEYLLMIHKWECKGIGITLKGVLDYQISKFHANAPTNTFLSITEGENSKLNGDVFAMETMQELKHIVTKSGIEFDLVLADGAAFIDGNEDSQEEKAVTLQLQEFWTAIPFLARNGTFLIKFFDISQLPTLRLVTLLALAFKQVTCLKTGLSRSGNSERYLLCQGFQTFFRDFTWLDLQNYVFQGQTCEKLQVMINSFTYQPFFNHLQSHMLETWNYQAETLQTLILRCQKKSKSEPSSKESKIKVETVHDVLEQISYYWKKWQLSWFHGLTLDIPCKFFQFEKSSLPRVWLFDNWDYLHRDPRFLSDLSPYLTHQLVYVSKNQLLDVNLQLIQPSNKTLQSLIHYPSNTLLTLSEAGAVQSIIALPKYPRLFLKKEEEKIEKWKFFSKNLRWWD